MANDFKYFLAKEWVVILITLLIGLITAVGIIAFNKYYELNSKRSFNKELQSRTNNLPKFLKRAVIEGFIVGPNGEKLEPKSPFVFRDFLEPPPPFSPPRYITKKQFEQLKEKSRNVIEVTNTQTGEDTFLEMSDVSYEDHVNFLDALKLKGIGPRQQEPILPIKYGIIITVLSYFIIQFFRISRWSILTVISQRRKIK